MEKDKARQFLELYQQFRYDNQLKYYTERQKEFSHAQNQALGLSIFLIFLGALAAACAIIPIPWLKSTCLLAAAICPVLSTALAGYNALYAFEQQAKIYQVAVNNLSRLRAQEFSLQRNMEQEDFPEKLAEYVLGVEQILQIEHGQWGQVAKNMKPPDL